MSALCIHGFPTVNCKHSWPLNNISLNFANSLIHGFLSPANTLENFLEVCNNGKQLVDEPCSLDTLKQKRQLPPAKRQQMRSQTPLSKSLRGKDICLNRCLIQMRVPNLERKR